MMVRSHRVFDTASTRLRWILRSTRPFSYSKHFPNSFMCTVSVYVLPFVVCRKEVASYIKQSKRKYSLDVYYLKPKSESKTVHSMSSKLSLLLAC